jgi:uncharacterized protein YciI
MEIMKKRLLFIIIICTVISCKNKSIENEENGNILNMENSKLNEKSKSVQAQIKELKEKGFEIFDYVDEKTKDTVIMQQYFMAFLKSGPNRNQNEDGANELQALHLAHLGKMYEMGFADISGPFGDDGEIRGITIYNVPNMQMADSLANADPMVKAGRLVIEIHPWWAAKGFPLR